jgi:hypothetical protein
MRNFGLLFYGTMDKTLITYLYSEPRVRVSDPYHEALNRVDVTSNLSVRQARVQPVE